MKEYLAQMTGLAAAAMRTTRCHALLLAALLACASGNSLASLQEQDSLLTIKENFVQMKLARAKLRQFEPLADKGIVSKSDIAQHRANSELAEIRFQRSVLDLVSKEPRITVQRAVKVKDADGQQYLEVTLLNATLLADESQQALFASLDKEHEFPLEVWQRKLENVFISIREANNNFQPGTIAGAQSPFGAPSQVAIALPYESKIASWKFNEEKKLRFRLLVDSDRFNIHISYRASEREIGVYTEQKFAGTDVELTAGRINQEANLGSAIDYPFEVHRSGQDSRTFVFQAYNLPPSIRYSIVAADGKNRVSQVRLSTGETSRSLLLRLELPDRQVQGFKLDAPLPFIIAAVDDKNTAKLPLPSEIVSEAQLKALPMGVLELKLVARGTGKLAIVATSLVHELQPGHDGGFEFTVKNEGSRALENVRFDSERPNGFGVAFDPAAIASVEVGQEKKVRVRVATPDRTEAGDYELRVKTAGFTATRPLAIDDKVFRLVIKQGTSNVPLFAVSFLFLLVLMVIVYVGKKVRLR